MHFEAQLDCRSACSHQMFDISIVEILAERTDMIDCGAAVLTGVEHGSAET